MKDIKYRKFHLNAIVPYNLDDFDEIYKLTRELESKLREYSQKLAEKYNAGYGGGSGRDKRGSSL